MKWWYKHKNSSKRKGVKAAAVVVPSRPRCRQTSVLTHSWPNEPRFLLLSPHSVWNGSKWSLTFSCSCCGEEPNNRAPEPGPEPVQRVRTSYWRMCKWGADETEPTSHSRPKRQSWYVHAGFCSDSKKLRNYKVRVLLLTKIKLYTDISAVRSTVSRLFWGSK